MDEQLIHKMLTVVHSEQWNIFLEWVQEEEESIIQEIKRADSSEMLFSMQGKLRFVDRLRQLKDKVMVGSQMQEAVKRHAAEEKEQNG
jgi:hypothetical protein|tara:strand:+ start:1189 stop:1452 length:264 start_codon:yes stop_codon:yes gene_type:complete